MHDNDIQAFKNKDYEKEFWILSGEISRLQHEIDKLRYQNIELMETINKYQESNK